MGSQGRMSACLPVSSFFLPSQDHTSMPPLSITPFSHSPYRASGEWSSRLVWPSRLPIGKWWRGHVSWLGDVTVL